MASMSKRQQARNERELHDLLRLPGNSQCADCGAKNPSWASWSLGIFLCMRCASLHRKLGTHISKVKSLSMDTWTSEQVENMKRTGNIAANKIYNPKNKKPDIPLDADEVDSAMERFIRKKYQEKSLLDGKPEPPVREAAPLSAFSGSSREYPAAEPESPPPPLPPKKGKFFGFGLRASSSAHNLSKHDKKKLPKEPRVDSAFPMSQHDYNSMARMTQRSELSDSDLQKKLVALHDMGFTDSERNSNLLRRLNGNVERTIEALVQMGPTEPARSQQSRVSDNSFPPVQQRTQDSATAPTTAPKPAEPSYNPFDQVSSQQAVGISLAQSDQAPASASSFGSNNPFGLPPPSTGATGLEQSFQSLQVTQPLFPHSTGGYPQHPQPIQDPRLQYSMTPPVQATYQQQGYATSPAALNVSANPFFQPAPQSAQSTGSNPFLSQAQSSPVTTSPTNPFMQSHPMAFNQQTQMQPQNFGSSLNPFGIAPNQSSPPQPLRQQTMPQYQTQGMPAALPQNGFGLLQQTNPFQNQPQQFQQPPQQPQFQQFQQPLQQSHFQQLQQPQSPGVVFPNYQYGQQHPQFQQQQSLQPNPLLAQQTGRYDKSSILALYGQPQLAPQPLSSIPEPGENHLFQTTAQPISPTPSDPFSQASLNPKRSATMPVMSSMHSAGGGGSRNPFFTNPSTFNTNGGLAGSADYATNASYQAQPRGSGIGARHASAESMQINNLEAGRHSPDAFASLSSRTR